jgi:hypothetical protein
MLQRRFTATEVDALARAAGVCPPAMQQKKHHRACLPHRGAGSWPATEVYRGSTD